MSHGELVCSCIISVLLIQVNSVTTKTLENYQNGVGYLYSSRQNSLLQNYCASKRPSERNSDAEKQKLTKFSFIRCSAGIHWKESNRWVAACESFTEHKTYPIRWYKVASACIITIQGKKYPIFSYKIIEKI